MALNSGSGHGQQQREKRFVNESKKVRIGIMARMTVTSMMFYISSCDMSIYVLVDKVVSKWELFLFHLVMY